MRKDRACPAWSLTRFAPCHALLWLYYGGFFRRLLLLVLFPRDRGSLPEAASPYTTCKYKVIPSRPFPYPYDSQPWAEFLLNLQQHPVPPWVLRTLTKEGDQSKVWKAKRFSYKALSVLEPPA